MRYFTKVLSAALVCGSAFLLTSCANAQDIGANVALHQKVTVEPRSNYGLTPDRDPQQLTDGIYASTKDGKWDPDISKRRGHLWTKNGSLTWQHKKPVIITIDLGKVQPISGVSYSTGGGTAGVGWPEHIYIATSDDGKSWHYAGDLMRLSQKNGVPPSTGDVSFRYLTNDLKTHGRYVALGVVQDVFVVADEVEVLRGDDSLLNQSAGKPTPAMEEFVAQQSVTLKAQRRQNGDITAIRDLINKSNLSAGQKSTFEARLVKAAVSTANMDPLPADFKTIIPITDTERDILAVHGEALAAQGFKPLTIWKQQRYAWLPLVNMPKENPPKSPLTKGDLGGFPSSSDMQLKLSMLKNQFRSDAVLLTNASGQPMTVRFTLQNPPQGAQSGWLKVDSAIWTDTYEGIPVQDALMPMAEQNGAYTMEIPAGVTGKLWVTIDSSKLQSGAFKSTFVASGAGQNVSIPLHLNISKIAMNTPRMSLTMWDYTNGKGQYGITPQNRDAAIKLMQSHFVDSPWATGWVIPTPKAADFDTNNQLIQPLDFSSVDEWIAMWPKARNYMIFRSVRNTDTFADAKMATPDFDAKVGSWMKALEAHVKTLGVKPSQIVICPVDEARNDEHDLHLILWGEAIKKAVPEFRIFSDPIWREPQKASNPKALTVPDILCPHANWADDYYVKAAHQHNKELWFYNGPGLHHTGDPQLAYRQMAWRVFGAGGQGEGFWAFGDISGAETSWNAYTAVRPMFAPAYLDKDTVYNSIHWDATREGVEDFEELSMLKEAIAKSQNAALKAQAQKVLDDAVKAANAITSEGSVDDDPGVYDWNRDNDPTVVDAQLGQVQQMLEKLGN